MRFFLLAAGAAMAAMTAAAPSLNTETTPGHLVQRAELEAESQPQPETSSAFQVNSKIAQTTNKVIPIVVGGTALVFTPNNVVAEPGDILQFQFAARNHTVTQSQPNSPCLPMGDTVAGAVHSGFIPFDNTTGVVGTFNVPVQDTKPMFLYCATGQHCQAGMVMIVNAESTDQLIQYANLAAVSGSNIPARVVAGGAAAKIPAAQAVFPAIQAPAPLLASSSSAAPAPAASAPGPAPNAAPPGAVPAVPAK